MYIPNQWESITEKKMIIHYVNISVSWVQTSNTVLGIPFGRGPS